MLSDFKRFGIVFSQYVLYIYVVVLTVIVINQISTLRKDDARTAKLVIDLEKAQKKIDETHNHLLEVSKKDQSHNEQMTILIKILEHEHKEAKAFETLVKGRK
jgi:peptidoglycan hydrolase CwlO-like protein